MAKKAAKPKTDKAAEKPNKKTKDDANRILTPDECIEKIYGAIAGDYGEGTLISGKDFMDKPRMIIPWSPAIDMIIGGGIQEGTWVAVTGDEKTHKTTSAFSFAATCQRPEYGSRPIFYSVSEGRLSKKHLSEIEGLDLNPPKFNIITSKKGRILTAEENLQICLDVLKTVPNCVLIIDSISALVCEKEMTGGVGTETRGGGAKATAQFIAQAANVVPTNDCIVIGITHLMCNTSGMGATKVQKATRRWGYQGDYILQTSFGKEWCWKGTGGRRIGTRVTWKCKHTTTGTPGGVIDSFFRFGLGIDKLFEIVNFAMNLGLISNGGKGTWYELKFLTQHDVSLVEIKGQGAEGVYKKLKENPQWIEWLTTDVMSMIGGTDFVASGDEE